MLPRYFVPSPRPKLASIAEAVVLHEGSTLLVVGNALMLLRYPEQA